VIGELARAGVPRLQAYPKLGARLDPHEAWTGTEALFRAAGFSRVSEAGDRCVMERAL
jgi:hypothetical protein